MAWEAVGGDLFAAGLNIHCMFSGGCNYMPHYWIPSKHPTEKLSSLKRPGAFLEERPPSVGNFSEKDQEQCLFTRSLINQY
jgi:hypothetical protein